MDVKAGTSQGETDAPAIREEETIGWPLVLIIRTVCP